MDMFISATAGDVEIVRAVALGKGETDGLLSILLVDSILIKLLVVETISQSFALGVISSRCEKPQFFLMQSLLKPFPHHIFFKLRLCLDMTGHPNKTFSDVEF